MKKISLLLITLVAIIGTITIQSCQTTGKASSTSKMLKFNFEKGKGYDYELITNMDQEVMGQPMQMDMSFYYSMDVTDDDGTTKTITTAIERFKMKMVVAGMNMEIDTDKPLPELGKKKDGKDPMKMLNTLFGGIKGQKISIKVESSQEKMKLSGDIKGSIVVDSRSGLVVNADQDMKMKAEAAGKSFEIKMKTKIKGKAR